MVICDIRFTKVRGRIPVGRGEATDSLAMPFARVVSKSSFDLGTYGAEVVASVPSDTATKCSPLPLHQDDSGVDDR